MDKLKKLWTTLNSAKCKGMLFSENLLSFLVIFKYALNKHLGVIFVIVKLFVDSAHRIATVLCPTHVFNNKENSYNGQLTRRGLINCM